MTDPQETPQPTDPTVWLAPGSRLQHHQQSEAVTNVEYEPYPGIPAPYQSQAYYAPRTRTNALAVTSFILGLGQIIFSVTGILAIIFGHIALAQIKRTGEQGRGFALAGLIIGYVGVAIIIAVIFLYLSVLGGGASGSNGDGVLDT